MITRDDKILSVNDAIDWWRRRRYRLIPVSTLKADILNIT